MKIVINRCHGGFGLSEAAINAYAARKGMTLYPERDGLITVYWTVPEEQRAAPLAGRWMDHTQEERIASNKAHKEQTLYDRDIERHDADLVAVVEAMGSEAASGTHAQLAVVEIPDGVDYEISEYDGIEHIAEKHRTWA